MPTLAEDFKPLTALEQDFAPEKTLESDFVPDKAPLTPSLPEPGQQQMGRQPVPGGPTQAFPTGAQDAAARAKIPPMSLAEAGELAMTPFVSLPRVGKPGGVARGVSEIVNSAIEQTLLTPASGPLGVAFQVPGLRQALTATIAASLTKAAAQKAGEASVTKSPQTITEAVGLGLMGAAGARDLLPRAAAEAAKVPPKLATTPTESEVSDASRYQEAGEVHAPVPVQPGESARTLPVEEGRPRVLTPSVEEAKEVAPSEESKPASVESEQAPPSAAPATAAVSEAKPPGVAAPEAPSATTEPTPLEPLTQPEPRPKPISELTDEDILKLAADAGFKATAKDLTLEHRRNSIISRLQELSDKNLLDRSVLTQSGAGKAGASEARPGGTETPAAQVERPGATPEQEYDASLEAFRQASRKFTKAQDAYRARKIGDEEFLAARKEFDAADKASDAAERKFIDTKNAEGAAITPVEARQSEAKRASPTSPAPAAAKVQAEVSRVARTEGTRPAKEIKNELVDRLERAIDVAPPESEVKASSYTTADMKTHTTPDKAEMVTIEIPGDGTFKIRNTKEALSEILKRAKRIATSSKEAKAQVPRGAVRSSELALGKMEEAKAEEARKNLGVQKEKARGELYDAINKTQDEGLVGRSQPQDDPELDDGQLWKEWRIRKATEQERTQHWRGTKAEIRWVGERRVVKFSKDKGRTEGDWLFDDSGKTRADVIRGMEDNMPQDATLTDEGLKSWRDLENETGGYAFLNPNGPGIVGMGGAVPSEFAPSAEGATAMKYRLIDEERGKRGLPPLTKPEGRADQAVLDRAKAAIDADPGLPERLLSELRDKPRPIEDWENHVLLLRKIDLRNEYAKATRDIAQAFEDGRTEDLAAAQMRRAQWSDKLTELEEASRKAGSERGRALRALQVMANEDFSLATMEGELRAIKGGERLTPAETSQIEKISREYEAKVKALETHNAQLGQKLAQAEADRALAELKAQAAKPPGVSDYVLKTAEKWVKQWGDEASKARERLAGKFLSPSPADLLDLAKIVRFRIGELGLDVAKITAELVADFGEGVRPYIQGAIQTAQKLIDDLAGKTPQGAAVRERVKSGPPTVEGIAAKIKAKVDKGQASEISPLAQKLARLFVQQGVTERNALVQAVHGVLKEILPDLTPRQTMDAISGYGQFKLLTKDEISVQLRDLKGQMQQIAKLEDMQAGKAPTKTGIERRIPSDEERKLIRLVNEEKAKQGYTVTDPDTQLRSALQTWKSRVTHRIADLQQKLADGDFSSKKPRPVRLDTEGVRLQADLERVKKQWDQAKRAAEMANRSRWQKVLDRFVRWERAFKLSSPVVFGKLTAAALTRGVTTTAEEVLGAGLGKVPGISQVARQAPREGGLNVRAMAHAATEAFTKGLRDAWQTAHSGAADIDVTFGQKLIDRDWVNFFGQLHGMLKAPVKRAEFTLSLEKRMAQAIRNGVDVTDPLVQTRLATEALDDGYRSIFMQHGFSSDMFNQFVGMLEKSKKYPVAGEISARLARFLFPVVRVPANIVGETATGVYGLPLASARTMSAAIKGRLGTLDPVVADSIMRQFKKGSIGLGLIAVGYFSPEFVGGYDWREKRQQGAVKTGGFQIGGVDIPRWMTHAPWFELMQIGATIRHVKDQHVAKTGEERGVSEGLWAAGLGLIEETPFVGNMLRVDKLWGQKSERDRYVGELVKSSIEPALLQRIAEWTDTEKRRPTSVSEQVKMGIPGLRQDVPVDMRAPR